MENSNCALFLGFRYRWWLDSDAGIRCQWVEISSMQFLSDVLPLFLSTSTAFIRFAALWKKEILIPDKTLAMTPWYSSHRCAVSGSVLKAQRTQFHHNLEPIPARWGQNLAEAQTFSARKLASSRKVCCVPAPVSKGAMCPHKLILIRHRFLLAWCPRKQQHVFHLRDKETRNYILKRLLFVQQQDTRQSKGVLLWWCSKWTRSTFPLKQPLKVKVQGRGGLFLHVSLWTLSKNRTICHFVMTFLLQKRRIVLETHVPFVILHDYLLLKCVRIICQIHLDKAQYRESIIVQQFVTKQPIKSIADWFLICIHFSQYCPLTSPQQRWLQSLLEGEWQPSSLCLYDLQF